MNRQFERLNEHVFVTKLAGFEHTKFIQKNATHNKIRDTDIPMVQGKNIRNGVFVNSYDWYISKDISDMLERSKLNKTCIIIPYVGSNLGEVGIFYHNIDCHLASNVAKIELQDDYFDIEYLKYYLQSDIGQKYLFQAKQGSAQPNITMEAIRNTMVLKKPRDIQKRIAGVLRCMDDKIQNNNKINQELESIVKVIYDYWFLQFDFPDKNGKPYKSSGGKMVWNEMLKREIPKGWDVEEVGSMIEASRGISYNSSTLEGNGAPMINLASFNVDGSYKMSGIKTYSGEYAQDKILRPYDLVMCNTQQTAIDFKKDIIGKTFLVPDIFEGDIVSSHHVTTIKVMRKNMKFYLNCLFNTSFFHKYISGFTNGTNILGLLFDGVEKYKVVVPSESVLEKFSIFISNIEKQKSLIMRENQELIALRDFLLPLLMNGQVGFKEE